MSDASFDAFTSTSLGPVSGRSRFRRWLLRVGNLLIGAFLALVGYGFVTDHFVGRSDATAKRDAATGILIGAEARDLGPTHSDKVVLFVHGCVGAGNNFHRLPELLAEAGWRVRVMRLPGHGTSPRDFESTSAEDLRLAVRNEAAALRSSGAKTLVLVGHSMGGTLATITAAETPVDGLILGGAYFGVTHHWYYGFKPEAWHAMLAPAIRWVYKGQIFLQCNRADVKPQIVSYTWVPTRGLSTLQELGGIANDPVLLAKVRCPVLMLHGPGDQAASYETAKSVFARIGSENKRFVELRKSNHHVFWDYESETVEIDTLSFARSLSKKPPSEGPSSRETR